MRSKYEKKAVLDLLIHPANTGQTTKTMRNVIFLDYLNITGNLYHYFFLLRVTGREQAVLLLARHKEGEDKIFSVFPLLSRLACRGYFSFN